jgi:hypothetical protein
MAAALDPGVVWEGVRRDLVCYGPGEVIAAFTPAYDANQEIDSLELLGGDRHVVLGARARELAIDDVDAGGEIYAVFTIEGAARSRASRTTFTAGRRSPPQASRRHHPGRALTPQAHLRGRAICPISSRRSSLLTQA